MTIFRFNYRHSLSIAGLLMVWPIAVDAAPIGKSTAYSECLRADLDGCDDAELERQDRRLNVAYRAVMAKLDLTEQRKLRASQSNWLATRDRRCARAAARAAREATVMGPGAAAHDVETSCRLDATGLRIRQLKLYRGTSG